LVMEPDGPTHIYTDIYGNPCRRLIVPAGRSVINYRATVIAPDAVEDVDEGATELTPDQLPDEALLYILPSRFCLPDVLGAEAWDRFGNTPPGYRRVQAICDYVHDHLQFEYGASNPMDNCRRCPQQRLWGLPGLHPPCCVALSRAKHSRSLRLWLLARNRHPAA
jgi:transglutaminase-like putative cysteine protease